jgi:hypothetical protein
MCSLSGVINSRNRVFWEGTAQLMVRVIIIGSRGKNAGKTLHNGQLHNLHSLPNTWTYITTVTCHFPSAYLGYKDMTRNKHVCWV